MLLTSFLVSFPGREGLLEGSRTASANDGDDESDKAKASGVSIAFGACPVKGLIDVLTVDNGTPYLPAVILAVSLFALRFIPYLAANIPAPVPTTAPTSVTTPTPASTLSPTTPALT